MKISSKIIRFVMCLVIIAAIAAPTNSRASFIEDRVYKIIQMKKIQEYTSEDILWLARNIYFEARSEAMHGKMVVAFVTLNRVCNPHFPSGIKEVVTQPFQFSWYNDKKVPNIKNTKAWEQCLVVANMAIDLYNSMAESDGWDFDGIAHGATHYYADYIPEPYWAPSYEFVGKVGVHLLFKS